jgi:pSer/pThr/pTyr-binding forkhead associated (FHA) protein
MSKATAAAALDDMLMLDTRPVPVLKAPKTDSTERLDDRTASIPASSSWIASVRGVPTKPQKIVFDRPIVLGRDKTCDVHLQHASVSRKHVRMVPLEDRVIVQDLDSANGIWVGGKKHKGQVELVDGQEMQIGQATITVTR